MLGEDLKKQCLGHDNQLLAEQRIIALVLRFILGAGVGSVLKARSHNVSPNPFAAYFVRQRLHKYITTVLQY